MTKRKLTLSRRLKRKQGAKHLVLCQSQRKKLSKYNKLKRLVVKRRRLSNLILRN